MDDIVLKIPLMTVFDGVRKELLQDIKDELTKIGGKTAADLLDSFIMKDSEFLKMFIP